MEDNSAQTKVVNFSLGPKIGYGSYGKVFIACNVKTKRIVALKQMSKDIIQNANKQKYVDTEISILKMLNNPLCVKFYSSFDTSDYLYIETSLAAKGEITPYIIKLKGLNERTTSFYTAELVLALEYLHSIKIIHRDIKPQNMLLKSDFHLMLCDFGCAKVINNDDESDNPAVERQKSFVGSSEIISPELLENGAITMSIDLWSLGVVVYYMHCQKWPFTGKSEFLTFKNIKSATYEFPPNFNKECKDFVKSLLVLNPDDRLGSQAKGGFHGIKSHPFFSSIEWRSLALHQIPNQIVECVLDEEKDRAINMFQKESGESEGAGFRWDSCDELDDSQKPPLNQQWNAYVCNNKILKYGVISKKKGKGYRSLKRILILAEGPMLVYCDYYNNEFKGAILWDTRLEAYAITFNKFAVKTVFRTYHFKCKSDEAEGWVQAIMKLHKFYYSTNK